MKRMTESESTVDVPRPEMRRPTRRVWVWIGALLLLVVHFGLAVCSKRVAYTTSDEIAHLKGGVSYWRSNGYRLHPEIGTLAQRWAALPAWLAGDKFPPLEGNEFWRLSDVWIIGYDFFYATGADHFLRLQRGRAMIALFSVATGLL